MYPCLQNLRRPFVSGLTAALLSLTGCTSYPLGLSAEQWAAVPPSRQAEYRARQAEIDAQHQLAAEAERLRREQAEQLRRNAEREHVAALYRDARYRDVLIVTIEGGMVAFAGKRFPYEPVSFELVRGESKSVEFRRQGRTTTTTEIEMSLSHDGLTFIFDVPARRRIVIPADGWEIGRIYTSFTEIGAHDGHSEAVGQTIRLRFKPLPRVLPLGF